ncbi:Structural maintenance of chromosomes protein 1 [Geranomyces variabilis]|nr:Structural maintenance of chromosomes protein 1 [Geranomyces variabilis]
MGRLVELEVENFKSYRGKQVIGPFHNFTSVIGPNGSGKSNLMDAISFVLGVKSSHLRSSQLKELIYRGGGRDDSNAASADGDDEDSGNPKRAHVCAIYETSDKTQYRFMRTVTEAGSSEYRINDKTVTYKSYSAALEEENILIKAKNFLVFQGDVEAVASQSPKDLTRLIEQISGSLELKPDYERLKERQEQATENSAHTFNKKRGINAEMKQFKEQKDEAERFAALQKKRTKETQLYLLWKLYHLDKKIELIEAEMEEEKGASQEHTREMTALEARLKDAKKQHAVANKELLRREVRLTQKAKDIGDRKPELLQMEEKVRHWRKKYDKATENAVKLRAERAREKESIANLQKDYQKLTEALRRHDEEIQRRDSEPGQKLGQAALAEYNEKKEEVRRQTAVEKQELINLQREKRADEEFEQRLRDGVTAQEARKTLIEQERETLEERKERLETQVDEVRAEIKAARNNIKAVDVEKRSLLRKETELNETLMATQQQLQQARTDRSDSEKETKRREMLQELKRVFEGVHGRMLDLCKPTQRKYQLAVSIILGRNMDAIVVDTEKIAIECIQYLREQRKGMATFLPLDTIQTKPTNERYRNLKGAHLALDVIQFDDVHARAMNYACGSALVCDTMDIARDICYNQRIEVKAVALDGTVIHKTGMITGGQSQGDNRNAQRWDDKDVENLRQNQGVITQQLQDLNKTRRKIPSDETLRMELADLESKLRASEEDLTMTIRKMESQEEELAHIRLEIRNAGPELQRLAAHIAELDARIEETDAKIRDVESTVFSSFCKTIGVAHIREYENGQMRVSQESLDKRLEFETTQAKLANQLEFEKGQAAATKERLKKLESTIAADNAALEKYIAERTALEEACQAIQKEVDSMTASIEETKAKVAEKAAAVAEVKKEIQKLNKDADARGKSLAAKSLQIDKYCADKFSIFRRCKLEEIDLPLVEGTLAEISLDQLENIQRPADPNAMDVDGEESTQNSRAQMNGIEVDFSSLKPVHTSNGSDEVETEFQERLANLTTEIDRIAPNMRAVDKLDEVEGKLKDTAKEFDMARKEAKQAKDAFAKVKQERFDRFSAAYTHIAEHIDPIYKELTKSKVFPLGGTAYLSLEDSEEPYNDGIKYHAMPPMKRFRDMDLLSGGEKTVAALALLFAIHSYQPAPFFVLDEVDAALDNTNVAKVANYIRRHASDEFQFIVISLKNTFYEKAEALVGIWKDKGQGSSRVLTLALDEFAD